MARLDIERQNTLQPKRMDIAIQQITKLGYDVIKENETKLTFEFNGCTVYFFHYRGWHSGQSIKDGRGLQKLLMQIKN